MVIKEIHLIDKNENQIGFQIFVDDELIYETNNVEEFPKIKKLLNLMEEVYTLGLDNFEVIFERKLR